ncbi:MAG: hypothetical protein D6723_07225 [Acidobacteria bacterium]|nr:MAG: hypothetical protein D6723_07225 [Acidobacteriota bacterium]
MMVNIWLALSLCLPAWLPQEPPGQMRMQVIVGFHPVYINPEQPSALVMFTLPDDVDVQGPAFLLYKADRVRLSFDRIYLNPQVPTPENPTCGVPDGRDMNRDYLVTFLEEVVGGTEKSSYALIRPGLLRPGLNRLLICEEGYDDDDGLFDSFSVNQIILVYTIRSKR